MDEGDEVKICESTVNDLAVDSVEEATMSWDEVGKVLDSDTSLESRCEESAERSNQACEQSNDAGMDVGWKDGERFSENCIFCWDKFLWCFAFNVEVEWLCVSAVHVWELREEVSDADECERSQDCSAGESFNCLLRA